MNDKKLIAVFRCRGGKYNPRYRLNKLFQSCTKANTEHHDKVCPTGCLGCGDCAKACPEAAIDMSPKLLPVINQKSCIGCNKCVQTCPRNIIIMSKSSDLVNVLCLNRQSPEKMALLCQLGCRTCRKCELVCPNSSIKVLDNKAQIQKETCIQCGLCAERCPQGCIQYKSQIASSHLKNTLDRKEVKCL